MSKKLSQNQKTFNKVARHLLKQNEKSVDGANNCLYRLTIDNRKLKCGIGALIPDRLYTKSMEGIAPGTDTFRDTTKCPVNNALVSCGHDPDFCSFLQDIHDNYDPDEWRSQLTKFAERNSLKMIAPQA